MDQQKRAQDGRRQRRRRTHRPVRRVWVQNVDVNVKILRARLDALAARRQQLAASLEQPGGRRRPKARGLARDLAAEEVLDRRARTLLGHAQEAAHRRNPVPNRVVNWFGGRLIEAAYQNLHAAEGVAARLYGWEEIRAEAPEAVARIEAGLQRDDPRRSAADLLTPQRLDELSLPEARALLAKTIEVGHAAADIEHTRLRVFRNAVLAAGSVLALLILVFACYVIKFPSDVPLCFSPPDVDGDAPTWVCPTGEYDTKPKHSTDSHDIVVVLLLGLIGGALSAAISIRGMSGAPTPYSVPFALAVLKVPLGALTAFGGLIALQGDFVPGLSELDSQGQILAYALVFGYAQQLLSGILDRKAKSLQEATPGKDKEVRYTRRPPPRAPRSRTVVIPSRTSA